jgi:hypothetical protein
MTPSKEWFDLAITWLEHNQNRDFGDMTPFDGYLLQQIRNYLLTVMEEKYPRAK